MYKRMAQEAREEGFIEIAEQMEGVAAIEKLHEERYLKLLNNIKQDIVFSRDGDTIWQCSNCGHVVIGKKAPEECPVCHHPRAYFQIKAENYWWKALALGGYNNNAGEGTFPSPVICLLKKNWKNSSKLLVVPKKAVPLQSQLNKRWLRSSVGRAIDS